MSDLTEALNRILNWLQLYRPSDVSLLEPGLSETEIEELIEDLPLQLPQDIRELYQWKNGSRIIGEYENFCWAFEWWSFYPLELVIDGYCHRLESSRNHHSAPPFYLESYNSLSIFFSPELTDIGYAVINDTNNEASPITFQYCKAGACTPIIKYASLTKMMQTVAECYEKAYYVDSDGYLVPDEERKLEIWRKYNSEYITEAALEKLGGKLSLELLLDVETDLIQVQHPTAVEPLLQALQKPVVQDDDLAIQLLAIKVLGKLGDTRAINPLIEILQDSNFLKRTAAIRALGEIENVRVVQPLRQLTEDEDSYVREIAVRALKKIEQSH